MRHLFIGGGLALCLASASTDAAQWHIAEEIPNVANLTCVFMLNADLAWAGGGGLTAPMYSTDGGNSWTLSQTDIGYAQSDIQFINTRIGFTCGYSDDGGRHGLLSKSEDGGRTWTKLPLPRGIVVAQRVHFFDEMHGWLIPWHQGLLWKTDDGGKNWQAVNLRGSVPKECTTMPTQVPHPGFHAFSKDHFILAGANGFIFRTRDGGATWQAMRAVPSMTTGYLLEINFCDEQHGAVIGNSKMAVTADGGATWQEIDLNVPNSLTDLAVISPQEIYVTAAARYRGAAAYDIVGRMLHTTDGGKTWVDASPCGSTLNGIFMLDAGHGCAVGGRGGAAKEPMVMVLIYR